MKKIRLVNRFMYKLRHAEHVKLNQSIVRAIRPKINSIAPLVPLADTYEDYFNQEDIVFKKFRKLMESTTLKTLDDDRINEFMAVKYAVNAAKYSHLSEVHTAGLYLDEIIYNYKDTPRKPYPEKTALLFNMIQDLREDKNAAYITALSLEASINKLEEFNNDFDLLYDERSLKKEHQRNLGTMTAICDKVNMAYLELAEAINGLYAANEIEDKDPTRRELLGEIIDEINSLVNQAEEAYYRHIKAKKPKPEEPELPEPADTPHLKMTNQRTFEPDSSIGSDYGLKMSVAAVDPVAFAAALYPLALGATATFDPKDRYPVFTATVVDFLKDSDGETPIGLVFGKPEDDRLWYMIPVDSTPIAPIDLMKNGRRIAILEDLPYPMLMVID